MSVLALLCLLLAGCQPVAESSSDEMKDPHFLDGKRRTTAYDYPGAVASFEKALETNPRSASAHFEIGLLFYQQQSVNDYAAAIYHFQRYLRLRPNGEHADKIPSFITDCKQQLSKTVSFGPVSQQLQRELEKLTVDNQRLKQQVELLQNQLLVRGVTNSPPAPLTNPSNTVSTQRTNNLPPAKPPIKPVTATNQTYVIKSGDTPAAIAKKYGISSVALMKANPKMDERKLQPGQSMVIPAP